MSGYQNDLKPNLPSGDASLFIISAKDIFRDNVFFVTDRNSCAITNDNILLGGNLQFKRTEGIGNFEFNGPIFRLPVPKGFGNESVIFLNHVFSTVGNRFQFFINPKGHVWIEGTVTDPLEEILFQFPSYEIETPIRLEKF